MRMQRVRAGSAHLQLPIDVQAHSGVAQRAACSGGHKQWLAEQTVAERERTCVLLGTEA